MDVVVSGRHLEVSDKFREVVSEKLDKLERYDPKLQRVDVEVCKESNPRLAERAYRVELTCRGGGPVIRAEASAEEKHAALDAAMDKLEGRLRRWADRRADHRRRDGRRIVSEADASLVSANPPVQPDAAFEVAEPGAATTIAADGPMVVREKEHDARPMTLDQALYEMELVGHDFYLYADKESGRPSVVYRRRGYDYGVIHLNVTDA